MQARMDGRSALITGSSLGLGKAMALKFAAAGAEVAIVARRADILEQTRAEIAAITDRPVRAYSADVADGGQVQALFDKVIADFGKLDVLVNNAGRSATGKFEEISDADWQADIDLKLYAAIRLARLALPGMKERRWGRIINVLNVGAKAPGAGSAPTSVSRAAGMALTKVLAGEGAPHNVLVNALCTGYIESDQWVRRHRANAPEMAFEDFLAEQTRALGIPIGRFGKAEEFANLACFLASDAGSYISGTAINVDGARSPAV